MAVDRRAQHAIDELATALRMVGEGDARHVVVGPEAGSPYRVRFRTDAAAFWGEVVCDADPEGRQWPSEDGADRLTRLGWRAPASHIPNWFQYFQPMRKRHYRRLAEHVQSTFDAGLGVAGPLVVWDLDTGEVAGDPAFVQDDEAAAAGDRELLDMSALILDRFRPDVYDSHVELTMRRKHHRVRIGVFAREGTISCAALHLLAPEPELVEAAFAVSDELDRVPYTYALRTVAGHGDSLVLLSKVAVMPDHRVLPVVGMLLYSTIEPLVAAHRELHQGGS